MYHLLEYALPIQVILLKVQFKIKICFFFDHLRLTIHPPQQLLTLFRLLLHFFQVNQAESILV